MKRYLSILLSLALLTGTLAGCGGGNGTQSTTAIQPQATAADDGSSGEGFAGITDEPVTLRFSWWGNDARHEVTLKVIDMYEELHPNVTIEPEYRGQSEREKIATELAGGTVADIVQLNPPWMGDFTASADYFVDLATVSGYIDLSGFDEGVLHDYGTYNGKLIALPTGINARTTIINKTQAEAMGIPVSMNQSWTWEDFYEYGKTVNQQDENAYFFNVDYVDMVEFVLRPYIIQRTGQQLIGDDYTMGFTREDLVEAFEYVARLYEDKVALPPSEGNVFLNSIWTNPKWINGEMTAEFSWTSLMNSVTADMEVATGAFILPVHDDAKNTATVVKPSQLFAISSKSDHPEVAADFINFFLTNVEAGMVLSDNRGIPPVEAVRNACMAAGLISEEVIIATEYAQSTAGLYENSLSTNSEITAVLNSAVEEVSYDSAKVSQQADLAIKLIEDILSALQ